jgi:hypothetical protein
MTRAAASTPSIRPNEVTRRASVTPNLKPGSVCAAQRSNCSSAGSRRKVELSSTVLSRLA